MSSVRRISGRFLNLFLKSRRMSSKMGKDSKDANKKTQKSEKQGKEERQGSKPMIESTEERKTRSKLEKAETSNRGRALHLGSSFLFSVFFFSLMYIIYTPLHKSVTVKHGKASLRHLI